MMDQGLIVVLLSQLVVLAILVMVLRRTKTVDLAPLISRLDLVNALQERSERATKEELGRNREESASQGRDLRTEIQSSVKHSAELLAQTLEGASKAQQQRLEAFIGLLNGLEHSNDNRSSHLRQEVTQALHEIKESQERRLSDTATNHQSLFEAFGNRLSEFGEAHHRSAANTRTELASVINAFRDSLLQQMNGMAGSQKKDLDSFAGELANLTEQNTRKSDELRTLLEDKLLRLQTSNEAKLDEMRHTVDEKLQGTLEKRLGESFRLVAERLEQVQKGLGEMQELTQGVGDLQRVLTNVSARGAFGEMQLDRLLSQILTSSQYEAKVKPKPGSGETVDFAIKLPGTGDLNGKPVWLPIDAKFPKEDYERLVDAAQRGDKEGVEQAARALESRVRQEARSIQEKYLSPPETTDFALLFLASEGLYAEVLRCPGLVDSLQLKERVVIVGPTTLAALLNSLQMGFRTLAIHKQSSEVWKVLATVKTQFGRFGETLDKVKKKINETGNKIDEAAQHARNISGSLRSVESLPDSEGLELASATVTEIGEYPESPDEAVA